MCMLYTHTLSQLFISAHLAFFAIFSHTLTSTPPQSSLLLHSELCRGWPTFSTVVNYDSSATTTAACTSYTRTGRCLPTHTHRCVTPGPAHGDPDFFWRGVVHVSAPTHTRELHLKYDSEGWCNSCCQAEMNNSSLISLQELWITTLLLRTCSGLFLACFTMLLHTFWKLLFRYVYLIL